MVDRYAQKSMFVDTMPWKISTTMNERSEFVTLAQGENANIRDLCRRFKISPTVGYKWLDRFKLGGFEALADQSRRPKTSPKKTDNAVEKLILDLRAEHPAWGARKLRRRLQDLGHKRLPAGSTMTGILHRHQLITPEQSQEHTPFVRFEKAAPNQLWQMDFKGHFALSSGRCHPLTVLDDHSRFNLVLAACSNEQEKTVQERLICAFQRYGMPERILCDNGSPWGGGQHTWLTVWLMRLGIRVYHGRAYHPQTQGKEERFHRTLNAEVIARGGWHDCLHVQSKFDPWRDVYNTQRPHESLGMATPATRYRISERSFSSHLEKVDYSPGVEVRKVDVLGRISFRNQSWRVGRAFIKQPVGLRPTQSDGVYEILFATCVIRTIDLNQPDVGSEIVKY